MILGWLVPRERFDVPCQVEVAHTFDSLHAHVTLEGDPPIEPGDEVIVHGEPIDVAFGQTVIEDRMATVVRANWLERTWTKMTGSYEFMELCEFSFSSGRRL
ncbi:MAG: hypothetical protein ACFB3T_03545 [Geminicoccaceae bacterium]